MLRALSLCTCCRHYPGAATGGTALLIRPVMSAFPERVVGSACASTFSRLAQRSLALRPAHSRCHQFVARLPEGRVENWRADLRLRWVFQRFRAGPQSGCHLHVSSPRHVERSGRFSRTALSCVLRVKGYETYRAGSAFGARLRTRYPLNRPRFSYSHCLLHLVQPKPLRLQDRIMWRLTFFSTQS